MQILCIGDVVGSLGCEFLRKNLPAFKKLNNIDLTICNGENSADGNGLTTISANYLFKSGVDIITLGNHAFHRREVYPLLDESPYIVRPINYPDKNTPGHGYCTIDMGFTTVSVINVMGQAFIDQTLDNPFIAVDNALKNIDSKVILVDFHAEATSEKRAFGLYLDGRVSAVFGTHTHVQTADTEILPNGTGYITDLGMTGAIDSVLGVKKDIIINRFITKLPEKFEYAEGKCKLDCAVFYIDEKSGKTTRVERFEIR